MALARLSDVLAAPFFVIGQALGRATSFVLGWATSLFFGQIPGGKERVVSILSAMALAWVLLTYVAGPVSIAVLALDRADVIKLEDLQVDDARITSILTGIVLLPPLMILIAELSSLTEGFAITRWLSRIPSSYPVALSLGVGVALMLLVGPVLLARRRRAGLRTHHIPVLVADGQFGTLIADIGDVLRALTNERPRVEPLDGASALPMRALRYAGARLLDSVVRADPLRVTAGSYQVAAFATDVNVTAPAKEAYGVRAALYKRFGVGRMHLTWSARPQTFERRLWELRLAKGLSTPERERRLDRLEREIDAAAIGSDEWNVLYRIVLQMREELASSGATAMASRTNRGPTRRRPRPSAHGRRRDRSHDRRRRP